MVGPDHMQVAPMSLAGRMVTSWVTASTCAFLLASSAITAYLPLTGGHVDKAIQLLCADAFWVNVTDNDLLAVVHFQVVIDGICAALGDCSCQDLAMQQAEHASK